MKKAINTLFIAVCLFLSHLASAQNSFRAAVFDKESEEPLIGATLIVKASTIGGITKDDGTILIENIPNGKHLVVCSFLGYEELKKEVSFPVEDEQRVHLFELDHSHNSLEEVTVQTTRSRRSIKDIPTRVVTISQEEIEEKMNMNPSNVALLLNETTGIQVQQTSASSANKNIRIQGLDGRYSQLLRDGLPLYGGFAGGLSILQIPPLDLERVELIKGPSSTLHGGDAIAGVINFITKKPTDEPEWTFLLNLQNHGMANFGTMYRAKKDKLGITFLATANQQKAFDVDKDDFSELPKMRSYNIAPKLFYYFNDSTTLNGGFSTTYENRIGGDMTVIQAQADTFHTYFERNVSQRNTFFANFKHKTRLGNILTAKASISHFDRKLELPASTFNGKQVSAFAEVTHTFDFPDHEVIIGVNLLADNFRENERTISTPRDYDYFTVGIFGQDTWDINPKMVIEPGLRLDIQNEFGFLALPRLSILYRFADNITGRLTAGLGYKVPTIFTEESERMGYSGVLPLADDIKAEKSEGVTFDVNYKTTITDRLIFTINQAFFLTHLDDPIILEDDGEGNFEFENARGGISSMGFETNAKFIYDPFKLFIGYTFTDTKEKFNDDVKKLALTPAHKLGMVLMMEVHGNYRVGLEGYYTGNQFISTGEKRPATWVMGLMGQKDFENISVYLNFENFTDTRQSRRESVVLGPHNNPSFRDIWTYTEGFYINGGIKLQF